MGNYEFEKDLQEAKTVEQEAVRAIQKYFPNTSNIEVVALKEYDIKCLISSKETTFEVKNELMVQVTGNVAIEFYCRNKDSGIAVTRADYWIEKIRGAFFIIPTDELRQRIVNKEYDMIKTGGDFHSGTKFYLVKEDKFKSWCKKMNEGA